MISHPRGQAQGIILIPQSLPYSKRVTLISWLASAGAIPEVVRATVLYEKVGRSCRNQFEAFARLPSLLLNFRSVFLLLILLLILLLSEPAEWHRPT